MMRRLVLLLGISLALAGCTLSAPQAATTVAPPIPTITIPTVPSVPTVPTADEPSVPTFNGTRAFAAVRAQVEDAAGAPRYRIPGTPGNDAVAAYISDEMRALGYDVSWHHFNATYNCEQVAMHNVVAIRPGTSGSTVAFAAHYDTRPIADKDPDPAKRDQPVLGANDGASGVAVLLELARVLPPSNDSVRFLFFDGEDGGGYGGRACTDWILGSRAYADSLSQEDVESFRAFVLVDMVGDHDLELPREGYSNADAKGRAVQDDVYATAGELGYAQFQSRVGPKILDDHVPFLDRSIPAIDLIHLSSSGPVFPAWHHTLDDNLGVVSGDSLAIVGGTLEVWFSELA